MRIVDLDTIINHFKSLNCSVIDISVLEGLPSIHTIPYEDAISKKDAIRICEMSGSIVEIQDRIENLPSVYSKSE